MRRSVAVLSLFVALSLGGLWPPGTLEAGDWGDLRITVSDRFLVSRDFPFGGRHAGNAFHRGHPTQFIDRGIRPNHQREIIIVNPAPVVVNPTPMVWVPAQWVWNGWNWVWMPGYYIWWQSAISTQQATRD